MINNHKGLFKKNVHQDCIDTYTVFRDAQV